MTAYRRETGVICYQRRLRAADSSLAIDPRGLLSTGLAWLWESARQGDAAADSPVRGLPAERPLTLLTAENAAALEDDFAEVNDDGYGRSIDVYGVDDAAAGAFMDEAERRVLLRAFAGEAPSPVRMVVVQFTDKADSYLFVPRAPVDAVRRLLADWGVSEGAVDRSYPYSRLHMARIESVLGLGDRSPGGGLGAATTPARAPWWSGVRRWWNGVRRGNRE